MVCVLRPFPLFLQVSCSAEPLVGLDTIYPDVKSTFRKEYLQLTGLSEIYHEGAYLSAGSWGLQMQTEACVSIKMNFIDAIRSHYSRYYEFLS